MGVIMHCEPPGDRRCLENYPHLDANKLIWSQIHFGEVLHNKFRRTHLPFIIFHLSFIIFHSYLSILCASCGNLFLFYALQTASRPTSRR
jgi:hypothetical protein